MNILVIIFILSITSFARTIVLIPGAASSGNKIHIKYATGLLATIHQQEYFEHLETFLSNQGHEVHICPKFEDNDSRSISLRADDCSKYITAKKLTTKKLNIIGHSMGGLVARKLANRHNNIQSILTISTPHYGTTLANFITNEKFENSFITKASQALDFNPHKKKYITELTTDAMLNFNRKTPMNPKTSYYSISNSRAYFYHFPLYLTSFALSEYLNYFPDNLKVENDGIVNTNSMILGRHLGEVEADHLESACIFTGQITKSCQKIKELVLEWINQS